MDVPTELVLARRRAGLTQTELARRAGTSQAAISAYESGAKEPTTATLDRLLGVAGRRLTVSPARPPVRTPSSADIARSGRGLADVLALAEALPVRYADALAFPPLMRGRSRA